MSAWLLLGVGVFGGLGALLRYGQDTLVRSWAGPAFPWGTVSINVVGSFVLGFLTGLAIFSGDGAEWGIVLSSGMCAGYTTFSTAMYDVATLARGGRWRAAAAALFGTLVAAVAAAALGVAAASLF